MRASRHSCFGLPFHTLRTSSQLRASPVPIEAPPTLAATLPAVRREPRRRRRRCVDPTLCKRRMTMAPAASLNLFRVVRAFRPGHFPNGATRVWRRDAAAPNGPAFHASAARDTPCSPRLPGDGARAMSGYPSPGAPSTAEAQANDARFHTRITRPPVSSYRDPRSALLASLRGTAVASCRGHRPPTHGISSIQRCLQASPIDRASPLTESAWS